MAFTFDDNASESSDATAAAEAILSTQPAPSEHAINAHDTAQAEAAANVEKDKNGTPFDPSLHTGTKLKDGTWRLKKSARGSASTVARPRGKAGSAATPDANAEQAKANAYAAGAAAAASVFMLGRAFGGEEWAPTADEVKMQSEAWGAYFLSKNVTDFPPGMALCIALASYAGPRFSKPKTQERVNAFKRFVILRVARWKVKRALKKSGQKAEVEIRNGELYINGARSDLWNNAQRENASSEGSRENV